VHWRRDKAERRELEGTFHWVRHSWLHDSKAYIDQLKLFTLVCPLTEEAHPAVFLGT
jgi:hypothetical protein